MWRNLTLLGMATIIGLSLVLCSLLLRPERHRYRWVERKYGESERLIRCDELTGESVQVQPPPSAGP